MNNISTQMAIMAGELIQKEEKLEVLFGFLKRKMKRSIKSYILKYKNKKLF